MKRKKGNAVLDNILWAILAILILVVIVYFLFGNSIIEWFRNLPGYEYDKMDKVINISDLPDDYEIQSKYYKVAVVQEGSLIKFCTSGDCSKLRNSKLKISGSEKEGVIEVEQAWDDTVGWIVNGRIRLESGVVYGTGKLYLEVKNDLPSFEDLLNLDNSIFISGIIYRKERVNFEKDDIIGKKVGETEKIEKSSEDINNYYKGIALEEGQYTGWYKLEENIENSNAETGWNTGSWEGDDLEYAQYASSYGYVWVRFKDEDGLFGGGDDVTPWIRMDYWNKYRSYSRVPREYIAVIYDKGDVMYK